MNRLLVGLVGDGAGLSEQIILVDLGVIVLVAMVLGIVFNKVRQTSALGYIFAGVLLGPLALKYLVPGTGLAPVFGELGIIMILFYLGLELNLRKLRETGAISAVLAFAQMSVAFALGFAVGKLFGFGDVESLVLGAMIVATSTVIVARFLIENRLINQLDSRIALGVLMLQDFFAIFMLVFLTTLGTQKSFNTVVLSALLFMVGMFFVVSKASRHILNLLHSLGHGDKMVFYAIGVGVVSSYAGILLGLSSALGAYFAGFALAESAYGERIKRELGFVREFFVLFFFVSFGATIFYNFDTAQAVLPSVAEFLPLLAITLVLVAVYIIGSATAFYLGGVFMGVDRYVAGNVAMLLVPLGEFVIIIANASRPLVDRASFDALVTIAFLLILITSSVAPILYFKSRRFTDFFFSLLPSPLKRALQNAHSGAERMERVVASPLLHDEYVLAFERIAKQLLIAFSIVYISTALSEQVPRLGSEFLPRELSAGLVVLLLVTWPLYKAVVEMRFLVQVVARQFLHSAFPAVKRSALYLEDEIAEVFTGVILTAMGVLATVIVYAAAREQPLYVIAPAAYTLLALMQLSRSFYSMVERYEALAPAGGAEAEPSDARMTVLGREFERHSRKFRLLHAERERVSEMVREAIHANDVPRVRHLLAHLKRKESRLLAGMAQAPKGGLKHSSRGAVEDYFLKQAARKEH